MSLTGDNGFSGPLFLLQNAICERLKNWFPLQGNIGWSALVLMECSVRDQDPMKSVVEAVAMIVLFILMRVIVVRVLNGLAQVIENIGELPIDEGGTLAVCYWAGSSEQAGLDTEQHPRGTDNS
jgi:hypothetical protein